MRTLFLFMMIALMGVINAFAIEDGFYEIQYAGNRDYCIDNSSCNIADGNNIHLWIRNGTNAQKWFVCTLGNGQSIIANISVLPNINDKSSFHLMDLNGCNAVDGNNIHLWTWNDTNAQRWYLVRNSDGSYTIQSAVNRNYVVDNNGQNVYNGNNIHIWSANGSIAQKWYFVKTTPNL